LIFLAVKNLLLQKELPLLPLLQNELPLLSDGGDSVLSSISHHPSNFPIFYAR
jgi:hypothetical protein